MLAAHRRFFSGEAERRPDLGVVGLVHARPHDADDHVGGAIEIHGPADDVRVGRVTLLPQLPGEDDLVVLAGLVFFWSEDPAEDGLDPEHGEEPAADHSGANRLRLAAADEVVTAEVVERHLLEDVILFLPVEVVGRGDCKPGHAGKRGLRRDVPDLDKAVGILERQRFQKNGVDHAEDGGICTDSEGQDQDGDDCESRALDQLPQGELQVPDQFRHVGDLHSKSGEASVQPFGGREEGLFRMGYPERRAATVSGRERRCSRTNKEGQDVPLGESGDDRCALLLLRHTESTKKQPRRGVSMPLMRAQRAIPFFLALAILLPACRRGSAQAALLMDEPFGLFGFLNPTGHDALYFQRICAETPVKLRRCAPGETGSVITRYQGIAPLRLDSGALAPLPLCRRERRRGSGTRGSRNRYEFARQVP